MKFEMQEFPVITLMTAAFAAEPYYSDMKAILRDFEEKLLRARQDDNPDVMCYLADRLYGFIRPYDGVRQGLAVSLSGFNEQIRQTTMAQIFEIDTLVVQKRGLPWDHAKLGMHYLRGIGCPPDIEKAKVCLKNGQDSLLRYESESRYRYDAFLEVLEKEIKAAERKPCPPSPSLP